MAYKDKAARRYFDRKFQSAGDLRTHLAVPVKGWIRAIRDALGMSSTQLAARMGVAQATIIDLERAEARDAIQLSSLKRAAQAMNCTLVYAFVPNEPLEDIVQRQARRVAQEHLKPVFQTMLLENQALSRQARDDVMDDYIQNQLNSRLIWNKF